MTDSQPMLASAVIVPDLPPPASPTASTKRRQSIVSEGESKRPRLSLDYSDNGEGITNQDGQAQSPSDTRREDRRKTTREEERKRGKRLFGGLLGTISQSSSTAAQRRRADIEKKQQAKLKQQAEELDQQKRQKLAELMVVRRREQKKFDEQSMRIRHSNMVSMAHFLHTKTEPSLYYKPWELTPEEESRVKEQIENVEEIVARELEEFERRRELERQEQGENETIAREQSHDRESVDVNMEPPVSSETVGSEPSSVPVDNAAEDPPSHKQSDESTNLSDTHTEDKKPNNDDHDNTNGNTMDVDPKPDDESRDEGLDENGDVVLEAVEDTVIY